MTLPEPADDGDRKLLADVARVGWHVLLITEEVEPPLPPYAFTAGLHYTFGHPEVVVVGLPNQVGMGIVNRIGYLLKEGRQMPVDSPVSDILEQGDIVFRPVAVRHYKEHLGYAMWFYQSLPREFPCLQAFWSDRDGFFPWDERCDPSVRARQTDLTA